MIQRLACKTPDRLAMRRAACEHQRGVRRRMLAKHRKHPALVIVAEVKETVPRQDAGKLSAARQARAYRRRSIPASENARGRRRSWPGTNPRRRRDGQARSDSRPSAVRIRSRYRGSAPRAAAARETGRARAFRTGWRCARLSIQSCALRWYRSMIRVASSDAIRELTRPGIDRNLFPLQEIRTDIRLLLDRIVVAIDAVGDQRVAGDDRGLFSLTEFTPMTAVCSAPVHLNGVVLCALSQACDRVGEHLCPRRRLSPFAVAPASSSSCRTPPQARRQAYS